MRLTKFSDYALRVLMYAASKGDRLATIEETAELYGVSRAHLKKVVMLLTQEGFLRGHRGRSGGFELAMAPEDINLGQVLRATEPDFGMVECFLPDNLCRVTRRCRLPAIVNEALDGFLSAFDRYSLADILMEERSFQIAVQGVQPTRGPHLPGVGSAGRAESAPDGGTPTKGDMPGA